MKSPFSSSSAIFLLNSAYCSNFCRSIILFLIKSLCLTLNVAIPTEGYSPEAVL